MDFEKLTELIIELEVDDIEAAVKEALEADGKDPFDVLNALTKGMDEVGRRYEEKEYYLTELVLAGETMKEAFKVLQPALAASDQSQDKIKIIIGFLSLGFFWTRQEFTAFLRKFLNMIPKFP